MHRLSLTTLLLACSALLTSCEVFRENKLLITSHVQTDQIEHPSELMRLPIGGQQMTFRRVPEFSQRSISGFEPFPAEDINDGYGALLQLDTKGRNALELASRNYHGMSMLTMVNGIPVDMIELDQPITDGKIGRAHV